MTNVTPDWSSTLIVLIFLAVLIGVRQIIVAKSSQIKSRLGTGRQSIEMVNAYRIDKMSHLSLFNIDGEKIVVLHGPRGQSSMLHLGAVVRESRKAGDSV